jgi:creatinine amidohydrolase/Fe(II)-dependent formamide hydrolase-like protein
MQGFIYQRPSDLQKALETSQTAYLPVGALRWHGRELPVGTDVIMLQGLCRCCTERTGGVVLPPLIAGWERDDHPGPAFGPDFRGVTYQSQLSEWLKCLQGLGVKVVIVLNGPLGAEGLESLRHFSLERRKDDLTVVCLSLPEISAKAGVSIEPGSSSEAALVGWAGASETGVDGADSMRALHRGRELALSLRQVIIDETRCLLHKDGR